MRKITFSTVLLLCCLAANAQFVFTSSNLPDEVSILDKAAIANVGDAEFPVSDIASGKANVTFRPLSGLTGNLGFTDETFWLRVDLINRLETPLQYYLETAEPVTDNVNLYLLDQNGKMEVQRSGDNLDFTQRAVKSRKSIFDITLQPGQTLHAYIEIRNDGEKNNLPLKLIKPSKLLESTYHDQLVMGLFFGILLVIAITYLFFYFALRETSFLHYSLYVAFMALCQFALDGFYHQYGGTAHSWLDRHIVILSAILSCFFFGKYSVTVLDIRQQNPFLYKCYSGLFIVLGAELVAIVLFPTFLPFAYILINVLTLIGILLIFATVITKFARRQKMDRFYIGGIAVMFICIVMAILMNFGVFPQDSPMDNITKPGIALEIIALSLSMANRIKLLKTKEEELQLVALQKSQEMNDVKSYFLSNMSHELRTPLNAILGLASSMREEADNEKIRINCETIRYASYGLISSVNDILDFSRIEKGELRLDRSEFKIQEVFEKLRGTIQSQTRDKGLAFTFSSNVDAGISVYGDPVRLEQMLYNLLGNACKFTPEGTVGLTVDAKISDKKMSVSIAISDTGIGIAKEKLESVFGLFSQSNFDNKRKFGGFGIGLSIVKSLVDLHSGKISLESEIDRGTTCRVRLEYDIAAHAVKPVESAAENDYSDKHVLIVEDNAMNQMVIKMMLKGLKGLTFEVAGDGLECLSLMKQKKFDLVLMDLQMPVMDGYEATLAIRSGETGALNAGIPIVVVTADITPETKTRVFEIGADDYLTKPVDKKLLYQTIDKVLFEQTLIGSNRQLPGIQTGYSGLSSIEV